MKCGLWTMPRSCQQTCNASKLECSKCKFQSQQSYFLKIMSIRVWGSPSRHQLESFTAFLRLSCQLTENALTLVSTSAWPADKPEDLLTFRLADPLVYHWNPRDPNFPPGDLSIIIYFLRPSDMPSTSELWMSSRHAPWNPTTHAQLEINSHDTAERHT